MFYYQKRNYWNIIYEVSLTIANIDFLCEEIKKISQGEEIVVFNFGINENIELVIAGGKIFLVDNGETSIDNHGSKPIADVLNLYEFLETLFYNKSLCGINAKEILFDLERK